MGLFSKKDFALDTHQVNSWGLKIVNNQRVVLIYTSPVILKSTTTPI